MVDKKKKKSNQKPPKVKIHLFFTAGPYDHARRIVNTLMRTVGEGNFDYMVSFSESEDF